MSCSGEVYDRYRELEDHINNNVIFYTKSTMEKTKGGSVLHDVPIDVPANVSAYDCESNNDKDMTKDAIIQLYRTMYQKWIEVAKVNQKLNEHVVQMNVEKREHLKKIAALETKLAESKKVLA